MDSIEQTLNRSKANVTVDETEKPAADMARRQFEYVPTKGEVMIRSAGIPRRFQQSHVDDLSEDQGNAKAFQAVRELLNVPLPQWQGLCLLGDVGTGKTHLAAAAGGHAAKKGHRVAFRTAFDLWNELKSCYQEGAGDRSESSLVRGYSRIDLFILDDLGAERVTEWTKQACYAFINARYNEMKPLIVTSNLSTEGIAEHFGDRVMSRLAEMCRIVVLRGEDRRLRR